MRTIAVKIDLHRATSELRRRFLACEKTLRGSGQIKQLKALQTLQNLLEKVTQRELKLSCVQDIIAFMLEEIGQSRIDGMYHNGVMVFLYSIGVQPEGELSAKLFEKF